MLAPMRKLLFIVFIFISHIVVSQNQKLSDQAKISIITCGPYQGELYSAFGHSAIRIYDPALRMDDAYNYGIFDFNQPHFYLNFARGFLYYKLGVHDYQAFQNYYIFHNRYIHEQVLNLTTAQAQKIYDYLQWNALPENEHYRYDYFYNNCATKMRDVVLEVFKNEVAFDGAYIKTNYTIRELTDIYLVRQPWGDLGIDIGLGLPMDKVASPLEYMFLPDYVESGFNHASIIQNGAKVPLVKETNKIYESRAEDIPKGLPNPLYVFSFLTIIIMALSLYDFKRRKLSTWLDATLFGVVGVVGLLLLFLWVATDHHAAANNLNILWALPTHLIAVIALIKQPKWLDKYFLVTAIIGCMLLITWPVLPQKLHYSLVPIVLALTLRAFTQFRLRKNTK
jgi:hypothetical protein